MFFHIFKNRLKILLRKKSVIFWTMIFPIILATLFHLAFSDIQNDEKLKKLKAEYVYITKQLNEASHAGILSEYTKAAILEMSRKVVKHLAAK